MSGSHRNSDPQTPAPVPADAGVFLLAESASLYQAAAEILLSRNATADFSRETLLCPNPGSVRELSVALARLGGYATVLAPKVFNLQQWAQLHHPAADTATRDQLEFVSLVREHTQSLFGDIDPWKLADELLALFNELSLSGVTPEADLESFVRQIRRCYGAEAVSVPMNREAGLVHALWRAWQEAHPSSAYLSGLQQAVAAASTDQPLIAFGFTSFRRSEWDCIGQLWETANPHWMLLHQHAPCMKMIQNSKPWPVTEDSDADALFSTVLEKHDRSLHSRINQLASQRDAEAARKKLLWQPAENPEQEALAIAARIHQWLPREDSEQGQTSIHVIAESRELARRIRALLERLGIGMQDRGGWAISTTATASVLETWLQAVESNFAAAPLLDLLKSTFLTPDTDDDDDEGQNAERQIKIACQFERDVVLGSSIASGIAAYSQAVATGGGCDDWAKSERQSLSQTLVSIEEAAGILASHGSDDTTTQTASQWLSALLDSLQRIGLWRGLAEDSAGEQICQRLEALQLETAGVTTPLDWQDFRSWLKAQLEATEFQQGAEACPVVLCNLQQSYLEPLKAVIFADASDATLNSPTAHSIFNDRVRGALGLPTRQDQQQQQRHQLLKLLASSERLVVSWAQSDERQPRSLWGLLALLETAVTIGWKQTIRDTGYADAAAKTWQQRGSNNTDLPALAARPAPASKLPIPALSARAHQHLIDCPYRFLYSSLLDLQAEKPLSDLLSKADFGILVHRILERFEKNFAKPVSVENREEAHQLLESIGQRVFARDVAGNLWHSGWELRFRELIEPFLDWAIANHEAGWRYSDAEQKLQSQTAGGQLLHGRADRIDSNAQGLIAITDYKTGRTPQLEEVLAAEDVQILSYALLAADAIQVQYLDLEASKNRRVIAVEGDELSELRAAVETRLDATLEAIKGGAALPANGSADSCQYCDYAGLCRHESWLEEGGLEESRQDKSGATA